MKRDRKKNHDFEKVRIIHSSIEDLQCPRLAKPRGLQIFDTRVDFPVPVQSGGKIYYY